ncbi:unnamed protein product [Hymenolepis diminuta]|uniref:Pepsin inhibitor-3-like repeated domain-containing protein n=1 Tax=Hymenolepis diminuta TaxID=6216 RepID=A0A0R3SVY6_HYMDI|nr:unnamed protein product [Hymenolepis diminuta]VUZ49808.1 unnamed protein product [Hymenolepis diminuta]
MHSSVVSIFAVLLVFNAFAQAQFVENGEGCTTLQCRRDSFLMKEREQLNEMQLDLMKMLFEIQTLNEQEAYIMGYQGAAMPNPHMERNPLL